MGFWNFIGLVSKRDYLELETRLNQTTELLSTSLKQGDEIVQTLTKLENQLINAMLNSEIKVMDSFESVHQRIEQSDIATQNLIVEAKKSSLSDIFDSLNGQGDKLIEQNQQLNNLNVKIEKLENSFVETGQKISMELKVVINEISHDLVRRIDQVSTLKEDITKVNSNLNKGINEITTQSDHVKILLLEEIEARTKKNQELIESNIKIISEELFKRLSHQNNGYNEKLENIESHSKSISEIIKMILVNEVIEDLKLVNIHDC